MKKDFFNDSHSTRMKLYSETKLIDLFFIVTVLSILWSSDLIWAVGAWVCSAGCCVIIISWVISSVSITVIFN